MTLDKSNQNKTPIENEANDGGQISKVELCGSIKEDLTINLKSCENETNETNESPFYRDQKLKLRGLLLIASLAGTAFAACSTFSLVTPFFPRVAEAKGLPLRKYSLVFSFYEITSIYLAPVYLKIAFKIAPKYLLVTSMLFVGCCTIVFGSLEYVENVDKFFISCILIRLVWSFAGTGRFIFSNLIGVILLPNHIATVYASIEIGVVTGFIFGPFVGGYLFEIGGFSLPFLFTGVLCFISIIPIIILVKNELNQKDEEEEEATAFLDAIKVPGVALNLALGSVACLAGGFIDGSLEYHLREIDPSISPSKTGQIFLIANVLYIFSTMSYARVAERWPNSSYYHIFLGCFLLIISFTILGPIPILPIKPNIMFIIISQCCVGLGMGPVFILSFDDSVKKAKKYLPGNKSTLTIINSLVTISCGLETVAESGGSFFAGQMVDRIGYRLSTVPILTAIVLTTCFAIIYGLKMKKYQ